MKNSKALFILITIVGLILIIIGAGLLYFSRPRRIYELNLPIAENVKSISIKRNSEDGIIEKQYTIGEFIDWLNENKKTTTKESISDSPRNATNEINFEFNFKQGASRISVYKKNDKYYLEQAYNGIYEISEEEYKLMDKIARSTINGSESVIDAVVVKANERTLAVMDIQDKSLAYVSYAKEGNIGFKQGQEVAIYFDGMIQESYPAVISGVNKIEITKEKSDVQISENALRWFCNSKDKLSVKIEELTKNGISFIITDSNEVRCQYDYTSNFRMRKKVDSGNTDVWENIQKVSNKPIKLENYVEDSKDAKQTSIKNSCNWTEVYGELKERRI